MSKTEEFKNGKYEDIGRGLSRIIMNISPYFGRGGGPINFGK